MSFLLKFLQWKYASGLFISNVNRTIFHANMLFVKEISWLDNSPWKLLHTAVISCHSTVYSLLWGFTSRQNTKCRDIHIRNSFYSGEAVLLRGCYCSNISYMHFSEEWTPLLWKNNAFCHYSIPNNKHI